MRAEVEVIHLRPHHGLCLQNFRGNGYSDEFSANMTQMKEYLAAHPDLRIQITKGADDLCAECPNRRGTECESQHPPLFDSNVLRETGLTYGQILSWKEFEACTCPLNLDHLDETCPGCEWLDLCHQIAASWKVIRP